MSKLFFRILICSSLVFFCSCKEIEKQYLVAEPIDQLTAHETQNGGGGLLLPFADGVTKDFIEQFDGQWMVHENQPKWLQLYDFHIGEKYTGLPVVESSDPVGDQMFEAYLRLKEIGHEEMGRKINRVASNIYRSIQNGDAFLPDHESVAIPRYMRGLSFPLGVHAVGVGARYSDLNFVDVAKDYYELFTLTQRAGFIFHEAASRVLPQFYGERSQWVSLFVTHCAFSSPVCPELDYRMGVDAQLRKMDAQLQAEFSGAVFSAAEKRTLHVCNLGRMLSLDGGVDKETQFYVLKLPGRYRFQLKEVVGHLPPTLSYFEVDERDINFSLTLDGNSNGSTRRWVPFARRVYTVSSSHKEKDIAHKFRFRLRGDANGVLHINGRPMGCRLYDPHLDG